MFRATSDQPFNGPHQQSHRATGGTPLDDAHAGAILIHGRGATAENILMLGHELKADGVHFIAPQAHQFQWYPYSFLAPTERNEPGLSSALQAVWDAIQTLEEGGISPERILLIGFSQGACLASEFAARHPRRYGGLIAFSGGLIGDRVQAADYSGSLEGTPVFMGCSDRDPHIPAERVHESAAILKELGARVSVEIYPGMPHTIIADELQHAQKIVDEVIAS
ncbi:MAG: alpha/beta hydrolase [Balneolaceae bacterium]